MFLVDPTCMLFENSKIHNYLKLKLTPFDISSVKHTDLLLNIRDTSPLMVPFINNLIVENLWQPMIDKLE